MAGEGGHVEECEELKKDVAEDDGEMEMERGGRRRNERGDEAERRRRRREIQR